MHNQNSAVLTNCKKGVSVLGSKKFFLWRDSSLLVVFATLRAIVSPDIDLSNEHPKYLTLVCLDLDFYIPIFSVNFLDIFPFKFRSKKYWFCLFLPKVYVQLISHKSITYIRKLLIQMFLNFIDIFLLTDKAWIIGIWKNIAIDSLWHVIDIY